MGIDIRILQPQDKREKFESGDGEIDYFFRVFAGQNQFRHYIGTTYVAIDNGEIVGYANVSTGSMHGGDTSDLQLQKLPRYPLPILRINRLGVAKQWQDKGIGSVLVAYMFRLALKQREQFGCVGVMVDAKKSAVGFYEKLGFVQVDISKGAVKHYPEQTSMFVAIQTIEKALQ